MLFSTRGDSNGGSESLHRDGSGITMDFTSGQHTSAQPSSPNSGRHGSRLAALRKLALLACALSVLGGLFATTAQAGTYSVWSCRSDAATPQSNFQLSTAAWQLETSSAQAGLTATDGCATGGSLELDLSPTDDAPAVGGYRFDAPPNTEIVDYELLRSLETAPAVPPHPFRYAAFVRERIDSNVSNDFGCASFASSCTSLGDPQNPFDPENVITQTAPSLQSLQLWVACVWLWCEPPSGVGARLRLFRSHVTVAESAAPQLAATHGTLLDGPATGVALLRVGATDQGGGIAGAAISVDGAAPQPWAAGESFAACNQPYVAARPCPLEAEATFAVDTTALNDGSHLVSGAVTDAAGNETAFGPIAFTVDNPVNPPAPVPTVVTPFAAPSAPGNGTPAVNTPVLAFDKSSMVRARGAKIAVTGTLRAQSGEPIVGAQLLVNSTQLATAKLTDQRLPVVVTDAGGQFSVPVKTDGAQLLRVEFAPSSGAAVTASASTSVRTRTELSLKSSRKTLRRGQGVTLKGKLLGAGPSAKGAKVLIQAIVRGKWRPVGTAVARADGGFKWNYKFVALDRVTLFSFRAVVADNPGWPWPTTASKRLRVKVTT